MTARPQQAGSVHVWDLAAPDGGAERVLLRGHCERVLALAWAGGGAAARPTLLSGGIDRTLRAWEVPAHDEAGGGSRTAACAKEHARPIRALSAEGGMAVSGAEAAAKVTGPQPRRLQRPPAT